MPKIYPTIESLSVLNFSSLLTCSESLSAIYIQHKTMPSNNKGTQQQQGKAPSLRRAHTPQKPAKARSTREEYEEHDVSCITVNTAITEGTQHQPRTPSVTKLICPANSAIPPIP